MGQYYYVVNPKKKQFLHPHKFGDGLKLMEFGCSANGTMTALALLLADGNGRGGGDMRSDATLIGSWAGDPIVISGDYADDGKFLDLIDVAEGVLSGEGVLNLHSYAYDQFQDISFDMLAVMMDDGYLAQDIARQFLRHLPDGMPPALAQRIKGIQASLPKEEGASC